MLTLLFLSLALVLSPGTQTITCPEPAARNQWVGFRKDVVIDSVEDPIIADIAVDSKYWLWVNGRMVDDKSCSTLWEGWGKGREGYGGGTVNHAWSGGPMIVIASEIFGIKPLAPGYAEFEITPVLSSLGDFAFSFTTVKGRIELSLCKKNRKIFWKFAVPYGTKAHVRLPGWDKARVYEGGRYTETIPLNN